MELKRQYIRIDASGRKMRAILIRPKKQEGYRPGILWIHGGGYSLGMAEMVYFSCGELLAERYGAVVLSPEYTLSGKKKYPAALEDCFAALRYMDEHREELKIDRIIVGGESAGGGLCAALCLYARDHSHIRIFYQFPLYPMLDCEDTSSSRDNHGKIWNTKRNHRAWKKYLGDLYHSDEIPPYASVSRVKDLSGMPPCYTFVSDGEPFCEETKNYIQALKDSGVSASMDVYHGDVHAFDMLMPWTKKAKKAKERFCEVFEKEVL